MGDRFLEEQVKRLQELTERLSRIESGRVRSDDEVRERPSSVHGRLHELRDVRVINSHWSGRSSVAASSRRRHHAEDTVSASEPARRRRRR